MLLDFKNHICDKRWKNNTQMVLEKKGFNYTLDISNPDNTLILIMIALTIHESRVKS